MPGLPNIVLTGFMGTGKTTVGRSLARRLGRDFVDTDAVIEQRHGPIPTIFAESGEAAFRDMEAEVAVELSAQRDLVIATGGRMLLDPANAVALAASGTIVCLRASAGEIIRRVVADGTEERPLLAGDDPQARVRALLAEREEAYGRFLQVDTDDRDVDDIVDAVCAAVGITGR